MIQSIQGVTDGLLEVCKQVYDGVLDVNNAPVVVYMGPPGADQPNVIISVGMDVRQTIERPTMGTNRSRERTAELDVIISVFVPGDEVGQQQATDSCSDLIDLLETYLRDGDQITLNGSCRESWISAIQGPIPSSAIDKQEGTLVGRLADAVVTVTAKIRY